MLELPARGETRLLGSESEETSPDLGSAIGEVDMVVGGQPCASSCASSYGTKDE
jgi:hypothetical protein